MREPTRIVKNIKPIPLLEDLRRQRELEEVEEEPETTLPPVLPMINPIRKHRTKEKLTEKDFHSGENICLSCGERETCGLMKPGKSRCLLYSKERDVF